MTGQTPNSPGDHVVNITHLRDCLGVAYLHVKASGEPIVIQRFEDRDVAMVPLWEWRFLKKIEAKIRAGECPREEEPHELRTSQ